MEITLTTPAILFPAVSLLLLAYTNRFMTLANVVRSIVSNAEGGIDENRKSQIENLSIRINLIKWMQAFGIGSIFFCVVSIIVLYVGYVSLGGYIFAFALVLMMISLAISFWEIMLSGNALQLELARCNRPK